ncbi:MAG TPA: cytochrome o ubiquinol oxidase subunit IV [Steroidobacteraceae bacterium]|nr:cytochrome o ubiquinol oxidase subunit IV [Steroidobacteraceae bacterium]
MSNERTQVTKNPMSAEAEESTSNLQSYLLGLGLAIVLTLASFGAAVTHVVWAPGLAVLLAVLAIAQMGVHLVFFLHVSSSPDSANTILALAFGIFVVGLVVFGSIIIMANLNTHMLPMEELIHMQR